jgi:hypothetical protein
MTSNVGSPASTMKPHSHAKILAHCRGISLARVNRDVKYGEKHLLHHGHGAYHRSHPLESTVHLQYGTGHRGLEKALTERLPRAVSDEKYGMDGGERHDDEEDIHVDHCPKFCRGTY